MNFVDPQTSRSDRGGDSSSTPPPTDRGGGRSPTPSGAGSQPDVIDVDDSKAVLVATPALAYEMKGEVYALPADIVHAVDHIAAPNGYRREGSRERSFMYSLGIYVVPLEEEDDKPRYFCLADPTCRKKKDDGSLQKKRPQQREHPPQEQKTFGLCSVRRVHTEPYPGFLPGYHPAKNFCKFCTPVAGAGTELLCPYPELLYVLYDVHTGTRNFCELCTTLIPVSGTSVSSVRPSHKHPGCRYSFFIPARNLCEFCNTSVPVPGTSVSSGRSPYLYPELL